MSVERADRRGRGADRPGTVPFRSLIAGTEYAVRPTRALNLGAISTEDLSYGGGGILKARLDRVELFSATFSVGGTRFRVDEADVPHHVLNTWPDHIDAPIHDHVDWLTGLEPGAVPLLVMVDDRGFRGTPGFGRRGPVQSVIGPGGRRRQTFTFGEETEPQLVRFERIAHIEEVEVYGWLTIGDAQELRDDCQPTVGLLVRRINGSAAGQLLFVTRAGFVEIADDSHLEAENARREQARLVAAWEQRRSDMLVRYGLADLLPAAVVQPLEINARAGGRAAFQNGPLGLVLTPAQLAHVVYAAINNPDDVETLLTEAALDTLG